MILAQGMKLLEKLSKSDKSLKLKLIEVAKRLKNDERKVVRTKAQKILEDKYYCLFCSFCLFIGLEPGSKNSL